MANEKTLSPVIEHWRCARQLSRELPSLKPNFAHHVHFYLGGGLMTGAAIRSAELLGADMALMGTRFIACDESLAHDDYRKMLLDVSFEDLVLSNKITGVPSYWIKQRLARSGILLEEIQPDVSINFTDPKGDARRWTRVWSAGHGVGAIRKLEPVGSLVETLVDNYWEAVNTPPFRLLPLSVRRAEEYQL